MNLAALVALPTPRVLHLAVDGGHAGTDISDL